MQNIKNSLLSPSLWAVAMLRAMVQHLVELPVEAFELESFARVIKRFNSYGANSYEDFLQESLLKILQDGRKFRTGKELFDHIRLVARSRYLDNYRNESNRSRLLKTNWAQIKSLTNDRNREKTNAQVEVERVLKYLPPPRACVSQTARSVGFSRCKSLILWKLQDLSHAEMACKVFSVAKPTVAQTRKLCRSMAFALELFEKVYVEVEDFVDCDPYDFVVI